jgi:hypothetical protein
MGIGTRVAERYATGVNREMVGETTRKADQTNMYQRQLIEFIVEVPNEGVANDVKTRIAKEHTAKIAEMFQSVTGYQPLRQPGAPGFYLATEPVTWDAKEGDWIGPDDDEEGDDDDDDDDDDE